MLRKLLFDTKLGEWLLALLEQKAGLAVVEAEWLAAAQVGAPSAAAGPV